MCHPWSSKATGFISLRSCLQSLDLTCRDLNQRDLKSICGSPVLKNKNCTKNLFSSLHAETSSLATWNSSFRNKSKHRTSDCVALVELGQNVQSSDFCHKIPIHRWVLPPHSLLCFLSSLQDPCLMCFYSHWRRAVLQTAPTLTFVLPGCAAICRMVTEGSDRTQHSFIDLTRAFPQRWHQEPRPVALKLHKDPYFSGSGSVLCQLLC